MPVGAPEGNRNRSALRPFEQAIKRAILQDDGKRLRAIAEMLLDKAAEGDLMAAKEVMDRVDGKPKQAIVGGDDGDNPIRIQEIQRRIIDPANRDG